MAPTPPPLTSPNATTEAYFRVGQVASLWSLLERNVDELIWNLGDIQPAIGACITAQVQSLRYKMFALISICEHFGYQDFVKMLNKFLADAEPAMKARNRLVHTPIITDQDQNAHRLVLSADRKLQMSVDATDEDAEIKLAFDISMLINRMVELRAHILARKSSS